MITDFRLDKDRSAKVAGKLVSAMEAAVNQNPKDNDMVVIEDKNSTKRFFLARAYSSLSKKAKKETDIEVLDYTGHLTFVSASNPAKEATFSCWNLREGKESKIFSQISEAVTY